MKTAIWHVTAMILLATAALASTASAADAPAKDQQKGGKGGTEDPAGGPAKFYGTISAVDPKAMTFTVGEQTFTVVGETHMTNKEDKPATLADAVVGEPARGSYTKSSDGKLNVTKVRFGKKAGGGKGKNKEKGQDKDKGTEKDAGKDATK